MTGMFSLMLYLQRRCRWRFVAIVQTSLDIIACVSQVVEVNMKKLTNENVFPEVIKTV